MPADKLPDVVVSPTLGGEVEIVTVWGRIQLPYPSAREVMRQLRGAVETAERIVLRSKRNGKHEAA